MLEEWIVPAPRNDIGEEARALWNRHVRPPEGLGRLESLAVQIAAATRSVQPRIRKKTILLLCGDHGVSRQGVSLFPQSATRHLIEKVNQGSAAISVFCTYLGVELIAADLGLAETTVELRGVLDRRINSGTADISKEPAMTRNEAIRSIQAGADLVDLAVGGGADLIGMGEIGIGNTTSAAALMAAMLGVPAEETVGFGTGITTEQYERKVIIVREAVRRFRPNADDPVDCLTKLGGYELGGLVGVALRAPMHSRPVVVDGFPSSVAALMALRCNPAIQPYLIFSHLSKEKGHLRLINTLGVTPLMDLGMALGEGTGAAVGLSMAGLSCQLLERLDCF